MVDTDLPPPPTYDLVVDGFTIAVPPPRSAIPRMGWLRLKSGVSERGTIIRDVSLQLRCESGEMMVIIRGPGSGKTTLLHVLMGGWPICLSQLAKSNTNPPESHLVPTSLLRALHER